jgi:hypothetical protein
MEAGSSDQAEQTPEEAQNPSPDSHVHLSFELAPGTRLRVTVEALPASGDLGLIGRPGHFPWQLPYLAWACWYTWAPA